MRRAPRWPLIEGMNRTLGPATRSGFLRWLSVGLSFLTLPLRGQEANRQTARTAPTWLRDGIVYEIFPRDFSLEGNFNGVTARLDELKDLGVDILWLMPIHPLGQKLRKGTLGSPTQCGIITRSTPITARRPI